MSNGFNRNLELAFIITISFFIFLFLLYPKFEPDQQPAVYYSPEIILEIIPPTVQSKDKKPPRPQKPVIPVAVDDFEMLNDIEIEHNVPESDSSSTLEFPPGAPLPFVPRQIVEIVPSTPSDSEVKGVVRLLLKINTDGRVVKEKVIQGQELGTDIVQSAIHAARQTLWEKARVRGRPVQYWVEKSYRFGL